MTGDSIQPQIDTGFTCALYNLHGFIFRNCKRQRVEIGFVIKLDALTLQANSKNLSKSVNAAGDTAQSSRAMVHGVKCSNIGK